MCSSSYTSLGQHKRRHGQFKPGYYLRGGTKNRRIALFTWRESLDTFICNTTYFLHPLSFSISIIALGNSTQEWNLKAVLILWQLLNLSDKMFTWKEKALLFKTSFHWWWKEKAFLNLLLLLKSQVVENPLSSYLKTASRIPEAEQIYSLLFLSLKGWKRRRGPTQ